MLVNTLNWISSKKASPDLLRQLDGRMADFYSSFEKRNDYQKLNDETHEVFDSNNRLAKQIAALVVEQGSQNVLEIGCGSGKIYGHLLNAGFNRSYTGVEMAPYVIEANQQKFPLAQWKAGSVYDLEHQSAGYDCCIAFFVLEHLIYPERALNAMLKVLEPGGSLILVFPDFTCSGIVPSQKIGRKSGGGAKSKLLKGNIVDAFISLVEGSMMRRTLKKINAIYGGFVINTNPFCLDQDCTVLLPDMDAIYIGSKAEVAQWAEEQGCQVEYPAGRDGLFSKIAFMLIRKSKK
jgi:ubiquinone/menaquinone biosynthesis C-methylase UbiE